MDILNSIGFVNFWGVTPFMNLFETEKDILETDKPVNVLLSNTNDLRHIIYTIYKLFIDLKEKDKAFPLINFYIHERHTEVLCRDLLLVHIMTDRTKSIRERVELLMEIYGNTLLPSRTIDYIDSTYKLLISFICGDKKANPIYKHLIDFSGLMHKEIDEMAEIYASYDSKVPYDIEKYRNDRNRYLMKDRYDFRKNLYDWDYNMITTKFAPIVRMAHYSYFRETGIAFEVRLNKYKFPNRTLSSFIEGRSKESKGSCMVRGYWGDMVNSPYISYGLTLETSQEIDYFYSNNKINYLRDSQDVTEYNLMKILLRLDHNDTYDMMEREREKEKARIERARREQEAMEQEERGVRLDATDDTLDKISEKLSQTILDKKPELNEAEKSDLEKSELEKYDPNELIEAFRVIKFKLHFITGNIEKAIFKKKKYQQLFDIVLYGFHADCKFDEGQKSILKKDAKILFELNSHMTSFKEQEKEEYKKKIKEKAEEIGYILDDTSFKFIYQFKLKPEKKTDDEDANAQESQQQIENKEELKENKEELKENIDEGIK